jgi:hypothetical protein
MWCQQPASKLIRIDRLHQLYSDRHRTELTAERLGPSAAALGY